MEVDMVNHRMQLQKYEEELARSRDRTDALSVKLSAAMGELETGKQAVKEEIRVSKAKAEEAASKVAYLEDVLSKQRVEMERIMHDYRYAFSDTYTHLAALLIKIHIKYIHLLHIHSINPVCPSYVSPTLSLLPVAPNEMASTTTFD